MFGRTLIGPSAPPQDDMLVPQDDIDRKKVGKPVSHPSQLPCFYAIT